MMHMTTDQSDLWIRRYHRSPESSIKLLCLPHAGGAASSFFELSKALAPMIEVLAVQYPGRQDRRTEPVLTDIGALADAVVAAVRYESDQPLAIFGHSMGAVIGFEVARRLERAGAPPSVLIVSARRAPDATSQRTQLHARTDAEVIAELRTLSGTRDDFLGDEEIVRMIMPAIRGDYTAVETYRYVEGQVLSCPVHAFVGDSDPRVQPGEVHGWAAHTSSAFDVKVFSGGHFYLHDTRGPVEQAILDCCLRPADRSAG